MQEAGSVTLENRSGSAQQGALFSRTNSSWLLLQERPESTHPLELIRTESLADMLNYCDLLTAAEPFIFILLNVLCSKANDQLGFSF